MPCSRVTINGVDYINLENDTVTSSNDIVAGKYGHLNTGERVLGTGQTGGSSTLTTKTITLNGTYLASDDNADGYSSITVNVQGGASMSEVQNTYGTEIVVTSGSNSTPSVPSHAIYWEFEDNTNLTETVYYPNSFVGNAITATTPTTYNNKTVTLAQLDGVTWYSYTPTPSGNWTTVYDGTVSGKGFTISELNSLAFAPNETWRVTWDGTEYICSTVYGEPWGLYYIGDINLANGGSGSADGEPFLLFNYNGSFGGYDTTEGTHTLKLERQVNS